MRILLDSNIWRYLVDAGAIPELGNAVRMSKRHSVVVSPAVLYEAAHAQDKRVRVALLSAMVKPWWKRLMPEAYSMAEEFKEEVRRLRPEWLRRRPNLERYKKIRYDWRRAKGGLWDRILEDAALLQKYETDTGYRQRARDQAHEMRQGAASWSPKWQTASLTQTMGILPSPLPGWDGGAVEAWRLEEQVVFWEAIRTPGHPTFDWIEGEIDLRVVLTQEESFTRFWLHDVALQRMRRYWLRWAFTFLQRQHRVTDGTPADAQLGTYLTEVDLLITADKLLVSIAERCRLDAPFAMAESRIVPGGVAAVEAVFAAIAAP